MRGVTEENCSPISPASDRRTVKNVGANI